MKKIVAIDLELDAVKSDGTAYYRLDAGMREFLQKCLAKHDIIGFEYEQDSWNFGVILKDRHQDRPQATLTGKAEGSGGAGSVLIYTYNTLTRGKATLTGKGE